MFPQQDKQIVITNGKKSFQGTISYSKNIDLTEEGYIKLSAPIARVYSSEDNSDFGLPYDLINRTDGVYKIYTPGSDSYELSLSTAEVGTIDSTFAGGSDGLRAFTWVSNNWFINSSSAVYDYTGASASTTYTSRIAASLDFIALFVSRNQLVGRDASNVNVLKQYNSSFSNTTDLTLPANFAITGASYSNELMGVITKQRKNQGRAIFATWDGTTTAANSIFEVNDPYILDVAAYKSSWVLLTSGGQLLYFNGGGFDELGRLPMFDQDMRIVDWTPTTTVVFGKLIHVDGDRVFVNCPSLPETARTMKPYTAFYAGGAYCFDPRNGFYHTSSPSYGEYDSENITFTSNKGTTSSNHFLETGDEMYAAASSNEIVAGKTYFVIKETDTTFKLAETYDEAIAASAMTITNGAYDLFYIKRTDYGIESLKLVDCGLVHKGKDYSGYTTSGALPFFIGAKMHPNNLGTTRISAITMSVPVMHNRGYFVLGKWQTPNVEDSWQGVAVKYSKLKNGDKIVVKAKVTDNEPIIVGDPSLFDTAAYTGKGALWDGSGENFTTMEDLTDAQVGDEVHVFAGPGAGGSAHITEISGDVDGGWQVLLDEKIRGTVSGRISCVTIDHFKKLGTVTKNDLGNVKKLYLKESGGSPSMEVKVELRGINVKVAEVLPIVTPRQGR